MLDLRKLSSSTGLSFNYININTSNYTTDINDNYLGVTFVNNVNIILTSPSFGQYIIIKNETDLTRPITITPASGTIDGAANFQIKSKRGAIGVFWTGSNWSIL